MAHHRLGHAAEARKWLAKADEWYDKVTRDVLEGQDFRASGSWGLWVQMAEFQVLHREAKQLIEGSAPKEDVNLKALQARAREVLKKRDKATAEYDHALMLHPEQPRLWLARGRRLAELQRWAKADADLAKAAELQPTDPRIWRERGRLYAEFGQPEKAAADFAKALALVRNSEAASRLDGAGIDDELVQWEEVFSRVAQLRPKDVRLWMARAGHFGRRGQWQQAATATARVIELDPSDHFGWYLHATLRLQLGDLEGYRRACREMLTRFSQTKNPIIADRTAKTCLLLPDAVSDPRPVMKLADLAVTGGKKEGCYRWFLLARGMAEYRDGRFAGALTWLDKSLAADSEWPPLDATACLFLAMARHRLGQTDKARQALDRAGKMMEQLVPGDKGVDWDDWLRFQVVRREAEALVKGATKPKQ
jgi:tetratricopeptide (TPR) repeat protein